jgi:hypothetical protein
MCGKDRLFLTHTHMFPRRLTSWPSWAYKTCKRAPLPMPTGRVDIWLQCSASATEHPPGTATVEGDPIARRHAADRGWRDRRTRQGMSHTVEDIICYF